MSSLCPNCKIVLVEASSASETDPSDLDDGVIEAPPAGPGASQISNSWTDSAPLPIGDSYAFANAAVIAATGDHGYVDDGDDPYPAALPG